VKALRATFAVKDGDWFNATLISKGLENLKKAYGQLGYINFGAIPKPVFDEQKKTVSLDIDIDEGKPFYVSRIEFQGNTITRDKVIRRELMLEEGSGLQLPVVGVQPAAPEPAGVLRAAQGGSGLRGPPGCRGGHRGPAAEGEGEGQELDRPERRRQRPVGRVPGRELPDQQLPRPGRNAQPAGQPGQREPQFMFGFSQPYCATARSTSASRSSTPSRTSTRPRTTRPPPGSRPNLTAAQQSLTQNYNQASTAELLGQLSAQAARLPARGHDLFAEQVDDYRVQHRLADLLPDHQLPVRHSGSNALAGIVNSSASFSYIYNTINNPMRPRTGKEYTAAFQVAGIGGNVRYFSPLVAYKRFMPMHYLIPSPTGATCWACARSWAMCRASAAMWLRPTTASTPAARASCAASISAAQRLTATFPIASPCS
jgi:outer membrane protein insertion porin family